MNPEKPFDHSNPWTRRHWVKQFVLGSVGAIGASRAWRGLLLADISSTTPPTDILSLHLATDFPGVLDGSTPSIQIQFSPFSVAIMITLAPFNGQMYVLNSTCTHQGCTVNHWDVAANILCPCHGSTYAVDGSLIFGVAGPFQPGLSAYDFNWDGSDLLQIAVPGLNLTINNVVVTARSAENTRLRLDFPGLATCTYQVLYAPDLTTPPQSVNFALSPFDPANQSNVYAEDDLPMSVWVDAAGTQGFYRVALVITQLF